MRLDLPIRVAALLLGVAVLTASGHAQGQDAASSALTGAVIGGMGGAAIGSMSGNAGTGALIGAGIGGTTGYMTGRARENDRYRYGDRRYYEGRPRDGRYEGDWNRPGNSRHEPRGHAYGHHR